jgi:hypothetical protein
MMSATEADTKCAQNDLLVFPVVFKFLWNAVGFDSWSCSLGCCCSFIVIGLISEVCSLEARRVDRIVLNCAELRVAVR